MMSTNYYLNNDTVDLRSLLSTIIEKKWFILLTSLIVFSLAITYSILRPIKYQGSILLKIQPKQPSISEVIGNPHEEQATAFFSTPLAVQSALIKSDYILKPVIKSLGLDINVTSNTKLLNKQQSLVDIDLLEVPENYINQPLQLIHDSKNHYRILDNKGKLVIESKVNQLATTKNGISIKIKNITFPVGNKLTLIKYPQTKIINKIRSNLKILDLSGSTDNNKNQMAILEVSLTDSNPNLIINILNKIALITQQRNINLKMIEARKTLDFLRQELPLLRNSLNEAEINLNHYQAKSGRVDIKLQTEYLLTHLAEIDKELEKLKLKKVTMLQQYTLNHPYMVSIDQEIKATKKKRDKLIEQLKQLPDSDQRAVDLAREVAVNNNLYMSLLKQIHQLQVIKTGITSDIQILSDATIQTTARPNIIVIGIFSLILGVILGSINVLLWKILTQRMDNPALIEAKWKIKNLATVYHSKEQKFNHADYKKYKKIMGEKIIPLLAYKSPNDIAIESLCNLRTLIQLTSAKVQNNIISLMSITKGVGKTFITANLASLFARVGSKVLIIEGDLRYGHTHQYFSSHPKVGLTDILYSKVELADALITSPHIKNLDLLPAGSLLDNPADVFMSENFKSLLSLLSKQYEYIFIPTPTSDFMADSILIGKLCGINLLIFGENMRNAMEIDRLITTLNNADINLNGFILNNLNSRKNKKRPRERRGLLHAIKPVMNLRAFKNIN